MHIFLRDLGEQRLKDLDRPVRLYQAAADGLPASFPPLRAEADLAQAAEAAIRPPALWRRPMALALAAVALVGVVVVGAFLATRDSVGGLSGVRANHVGLIDAETNAIVAEIPVGIRPGPIAGADGSVWVGNLEDRSLTRIDAGQLSVVATVSLDNRTPTGVAVGAGGVWVAHGMRGQVSRVDQQFNRLTSTLDVATPASRTGVIAVGEGSVWAAFGDSTLARIEPAGPRVTSSSYAGGVASAIVVGSGAVWVTEVLGLGECVIYAIARRPHKGGHSNLRDGRHVDKSGASEPCSTTTQPSKSSSLHGAFMGTTVLPSDSARKLPQSAARSPSFVSHS